MVDDPCDGDNVVGVDPHVVHDPNSHAFKWVPYRNDRKSTLAFNIVSCSRSSASARLAGQVGLGSSATFRDRFMRLVGTSPHAYRCAFRASTSITGQPRRRPADAADPEPARAR